MYENYIKRILDIIISLLLLIILLPLMLVMYLLVKIKLGTPIIFRQERSGKDTKIFTLYKFRTMTDRKDENGKLLPDMQRLTKFGKFLRNSSLDEIPELFNILKGDMSFVGPRPLLKKYLGYYTEMENARHNVRPGLTGLAQIKGRNLLNWEERFEEDLKYVNNVTFVGDVKIIIKTIKKVLKKEGIVVRQENPMLDLDEERKRKVIIKEMELREILKYEEILKLYISELLKISNISNIDKEEQRIYNNMIKFKEDKTAILIGSIDKEKNDLVGFIWGYKNLEKMHINYFYINNKYRKQGLGKKLIETIYEKAKEKNIEKIELLVYAKNYNARKFYEKQGFENERIFLCKRI